jgi:hypothetical protein
MIDIASSWLKGARFGCLAPGSKRASLIGELLEMCHQFFPHPPNPVLAKLYPLREKTSLLQPENVLERLGLHLLELLPTDDFHN